MDITEQMIRDYPVKKLNILTSIYVKEIVEGEANCILYDRFTARYGERLHLHSNANTKIRFSMEVSSEVPVFPVLFQEIEDQQPGRPGNTMGHMNVKWEERKNSERKFIYQTYDLKKNFKYSLQLVSRVPQTTHKVRVTLEIQNEDEIYIAMKS